MRRRLVYSRLHLSSFLYTAPASHKLSSLSLHDALPIYPVVDHLREVTGAGRADVGVTPLRRERREDRLETLHRVVVTADRSEEHTSELQSHSDLVCRLLLEKKKKITHGSRDKIVYQNDM